jgi:hypothetical protein
MQSARANLRWVIRHGTVRARRNKGKPSMSQIAGGCLCGKVRYSATGEPAFVGVCHCTDCQKFTGSAFSIVIGVPKAALKCEGTLATYSKAGDTGGTVERRFCPTCGSSIVDEGAALPDIVMLGAGTLDDPSWVKPAMEIFCDSAQPWVQLHGEMRRFPKMPG